jgi:hypothetical protein
MFRTTSKPSFMKKLFITLLLIIGAVSFSTAQKVINDANAMKREVGSFHGIHVATGIELWLTEGNTEEVAVSASKEEFRDRIVTKVENGILKIQYETKTGSINKRREDKNLKAYVSYKRLDKIEASTGAEIKVNGVLTSSSLELRATTGAIFDGVVDIKSLIVDQSTGSKIDMTGKAETLKVEGSTGSKFTAEEMVTNSCSVSVSTGAKVSVTAEKELQAKASTGGIIKYKGNASIKEIKTNTGGAVTKI